MSEQGWFALRRGILDHPMFTRGTQPLSVFEAWVWLIEKAAYRDHKKWAAGRMFDVRRGQLIAAPRHLAGQWRWSEGRARGQLRRFAAENMISTRVEHGVTILTLCNYDKYQLERLAFDSARAHDERKKEQGNNTATLGEGGAPRGKSLISEEAFTVAAEVIEAMGLHPHDPRAVGAPMIVQGWLNCDLHRDHIAFAVRRVMARRPGDPPSSLNYFFKAILKAKSELTPQLPTAGVDDVPATHQPNLRLFRAVENDANARPARGRGQGAGFARLAARLAAGSD